MAVRLSALHETGTVGEYDDASATLRAAVNELPPWPPGAALLKRLESGFEWLAEEAALEAENDPNASIYGDIANDEFAAAEEERPYVCVKPGAAPKPRPTPETVTMKGRGTKNTQRFELSGGDYVVRWTASSANTFGCFHGAFLRSVDGTSTFEDVGSELINGRRTVNGETNLYGLGPGQYYFDVNSGCSWSLTIRLDE